MRFAGLGADRAITTRISRLRLASLTLTTVIAGIALAIGIGWRLVRDGLTAIPGQALACFAAILVQYAILGTIRAELFDTAAEYSRYAYLSAIFALLGFAALVGHRSLTGPGRWRLARVGGLTIVTTLAITWNVWLLIAGRAIFLDRADTTRAKVIVAMGDLGPGIGPTQAVIFDRKVTDLRAALDRFGVPLTDSLTGDAVRPVPPEIVDSIRATVEAGSAIP